MSLYHVVKDYCPDLILGDFNRVLHESDRNPVRTDRGLSVRTLAETIEEGGYIDGWRKTHPDVRQFTYWADNEMLSASRIDRIYATPSFYLQCAGWRLLGLTDFIDHAACMVEYVPKDKVDIGKINGDSRFDSLRLLRFKVFL